MKTRESKPPLIVVYEKAVIKEIERVVKRVMKDCRRFKVPVTRKLILDQKVHNTYDWYGVTGKTRGGRYVMAISAVLFVHFSTEVDEALKNVIAHELCHTCPRSMNHGKEWKKWVNRMNEHGYKINPQPYSKKEVKDLY